MERRNESAEKRQIKSPNSLRLATTKHPRSFCVDFDCGPSSPLPDLEFKNQRKALPQKELASARLRSLRSLRLAPAKDALDRRAGVRLSVRRLPHPSKCSPERGEESYAFFQSPALHLAQKTDTAVSEFLGILIGKKKKIYDSLTA